MSHHGPESQTESEESYEEDFESYCSDFEDYSDAHTSEQKDSDTVNIQKEVPEILEDRYNRQLSFGLEFGEEREKIRKLRICQKTAKRAEDLLKMIRFDIMTFELFNLPPDEGFHPIVKQGMKLVTKFIYHNHSVKDRRSNRWDWGVLKAFLTPKDFDNEY